MIIFKILSDFFAYIGKFGYINPFLSVIIHLVIESYLFYLIQNKNIFDAIHLPFKQVVSSDNLLTGAFGQDAY